MMKIFDSPTIVWIALIAFVIIAIKGQMDYNANIAASAASSTAPAGAKSTVKT